MPRLLTLEHCSIINLCCFQPLTPGKFVIQQHKTNRDNQEKGVPDGVGIAAAVGFQVYLSQPVYGYLQSLERQSQEMTQSQPEFLILLSLFTQWE